MRNPAVAGSFYPFNSNELRKIIESNINITSSLRSEVIPKGLIAPHAGYTYCGKTFGAVYSNISSEPSEEPICVIILGPNHYGSGIATSNEDWKTPLGVVEIDKDFLKSFRGSLILEDNRAHLREHSIEVQLPWLQVCLKNFKFIPISISHNFYDESSLKEIANTIAAAVKDLGKKVLLIASSDFTHYGRAYGEEKYRGSIKEILRKIKTFDLEAASFIEKVMPNRFLEFCQENRASICGYGPITSILFSAKNLGITSGKVLDYRTSFEISRDVSAIVGYCGISLL